mmetsp:Transcript_52/g.54  ORF Transcript_52/g.54 Transcript_52/m.54 type:complete len:276 (-) Transcript_52:78-905(-)
MAICLVLLAFVSLVGNTSAESTEGGPKDDASSQLKVAYPTPDYVVKCDTTKGPFRIHVVEDWAPLGASRFREMVESGFYNDGVAFFRVVTNFLVQYGISSNVSTTEKWGKVPPLRDDVVAETPKFKRGYVSFAGGGPNSRTTQTFITFSDSTHLGHAPWETPFGYVTLLDMKNVIDKLFSGYGDMVDFGGTAPDQGRLRREGGEYIKTEFPDIDLIEKCVIARKFRAKDLIVKAEEKLGRFWSVVLVFSGAMALLALISIAARLAMKSGGQNKRD